MKTVRHIQHLEHSDVLRFGASMNRERVIRKLLRGTLSELGIGEDQIQAGVLARVWVKTKRALIRLNAVRNGREALQLLAGLRKLSKYLDGSSTSRWGSRRRSSKIP